MTVNMTVGPHESLRGFKFSNVENHEKWRKNSDGGRWWTFITEISVSLDPRRQNGVKRVLGRRLKPSEVKMRSQRSFYWDIHLIKIVAVTGGWAWGYMVIRPTVCVETCGKTYFLSNTGNMCRYFRENSTKQDVRFGKMWKIGSVWMRLKFKTIKKSLSLLLTEEWQWFFDFLRSSYWIFWTFLISRSTRRSCGWPLTKPHDRKLIHIVQTFFTWRLVTVVSHTEGPRCVKCKRGFVLSFAQVVSRDAQKSPPLSHLRVKSNKK